jgi:hypothetical protein
MITMVVAIPAVDPKDDARKRAHAGLSTRFSALTGISKYRRALAHADRWRLHDGGALSLVPRVLEAWRRDGSGHGFAALHADVMRAAP